MKFGLVAALEDLKSGIEKTGMMRVEVLSHGIDHRLESSIEIELYRVVQEVVNNILKHAQATEITIQIIQNNERLNLTVEDNGIGYDRNDKNFKPGMGLANIQSRIAKIGGDIFIDSGKGNGTTVSIDLKLKIPVV